MSIYQGNTTCYFLIQAIFSDFFLDPNPDPDPGESQDFGPGPGGVPKWRVSNNLTCGCCKNQTVGFINTRRLHHARLVTSLLLLFHFSAYNPTILI